MWGALLDRTVTLQHKVTTASNIGGQGTPTFTAAGTFRASVQAANAKTVADYARRQISVTHAIYTTENLDSATFGVKPGDRVKDGTVYYAVHGIGGDQNSVISPTPLFKLVCERMRI